MFKKVLYYTCMLSVTALMSGCVVKQKVDVGYVPIKKETSAEYTSINLAVNDQRDFVVNGQKHPSFIGLYRSGFGIPWDVNTQDNIPLAKVIETSLANELSSLGFIKDGNDKKTLKVAINQWRFEGYQNTAFAYNLKIQVVDYLGKPIADSVVQNTMEIKGTLLMGARGGVERDMPTIYQNIIQKIVQDNTILASLKN